MPVFYLPMIFYAAMMDGMFRGWGFSAKRATIIAHEDTKTTPAPLQLVDYSQQ